MSEKRRRKCPYLCRFCGARLRRDPYGHYCPTQNCQWSLTGPGCPCECSGPGYRFALRKALKEKK